MPRYYFDIDDAEHATVDAEGSEHSDAEEARKEGVEALASIVKDALPDGNVRDFTMNVRNEAGMVIFKATIALRSHWVEGHQP